VTPSEPSASPNEGVAPADAPKGNLVDRFAPRASRPFLRMARLDRPIGWWLLLLPCWWSSLLASAHLTQTPNLWHLLLFLIGAVSMRGAGSTWNDIVDRDLDGRVERTRSRPLPSGQISVKAAVASAALLSLIGLAVLLSFNRTTILLGFLSLAPVAIYPFMKRITNYPQAVLGLAFAWGALMGWPALTGSLSAAALALYGGTILWVIGYDTIYAMQDIEDDGIVGIRSTARHFGDRAPQLVSWCYEGMVLLTAAALLMAGAGWPTWLGLCGFAAHLLWQYRRIDLNDPACALMLFRSNRDAGLILAAGLALDCFL
jgi:4-hydroxybenzoate polyprenyltransferase